ncbi:MAG TPA: PQQ-binding-like beta-propeller repeat protein [Prosthecobacter sp.]|nr:PQQ-binding-like beta-propeller repeat protein [Prosthecobacter sp.]
MKPNPLHLAFLLSTALSLHAADWLTFRGGPERTDISGETGLLKEWPAGGPKIVWLNKDAGLGYSGFAVVEGTVYTMGARDAVEYLIALDAATGKEKWAAEVGALLKNDWGNGPRGSPTVVGGKVYAMGGKGDLTCVNAADGKEVWRASMTALGGSVPTWGYCESPLVDGELVVCTPGGGKGTMAAFDRNTGKQVWQSAEWTDNAHYSSIVAATHNGARQLIQLTKDNFAGVDSKNGKILWKVAYPGKTAVIPTPIFHDGQVFVAAGYGVGCKSVRIGPNNEIEELYANTNMVNHHGGVILVDGHVYGYSDTGKAWTCLNLKTGEVVWAEKKALGKGAIHCADGKFYLLEESSGTVVLIDASPSGWKESGRFKLDPQTEQRSPKGKIWTHPVVSGGKLYLRDQELVFCYDVSAK